MRDLIIFGIGDLARIAREYFTFDSIYRVVAFTVHREYIEAGEIEGVPVLPFEEIEYQYPTFDVLKDIGSSDAQSYRAPHMYVACVYGNMNRDRAAIARQAKEKGYALASYISPRAFVAESAKIGEHCFIFEDNTIQPYVEIGNNCILWSGNHVGHHSVIRDDVFVSSHVVISGHCDIGANCFIGVNSTLANGTVVGKESWVSHGAVLSGEVPSGSIVHPVGKSVVQPLNEAALKRALERAKK